ncbi:hypothetical protein PV721_27880 [Streptomyces sp. MB09-01]|uniref:hypothetical protein n=1 Tax=Streptomyces sp. MB09-01 TaxID=3028666 RepID=UPI0029BDD288|nr:hypothetical protein [Streptomyces sp. MB09-01]MDX3538105.1 hypothetical protein [Streptomyces sp. MB09-01]
MRLIADGTTPILRSVLVDELTTDDGYAFELADPLLLPAGDRIALEGVGLLVTRADVELVTRAGNWSTRCDVGNRAGSHQSGEEADSHGVSNMDRALPGDRQ